MPGTIRHVRGSITSVGFTSGHRFVTGHWPESPVGPMHDVMWAQPDDTRVLLAPTGPVADFITEIYDFDEVRVIDLDVRRVGRTLSVCGAGLQLDAVGGRLWPLPIPRPLAVTRHVEAPIARRLMGVHTYGVSPTGAREWYQTSGLRWLRSATATLGGQSLGNMCHIERPVGVGFSEPPRRPSMVSVKVTIDLPAS